MTRPTTCENIIMERKMRSTKRIMRLIRNKIYSFKKTIKGKVGRAEQEVSLVHLLGVGLPSLRLSSLSQHDKKLNKHLEFPIANFAIDKINKQSEKMKIKRNPYR